MSDKPPWLKAHGTPWRRGPGRPVYDNPWISVTEFDATAPTGRPALYGLVGFKNRALAILPLRPPAPASGAAAPVFGLLVLASPDAQRFASGMGTDFLERIADLCGAALSQLR